MVEFTTQFCDSASFCQTALRQYGRYEKDADTKQLPFLNEHTVIAYITEGSGSLKLGTSLHTIEAGSVLVMFPDVCVNASAFEGSAKVMWAEMSGDPLPKILARAGLTPQKPILSLADLGEHCKTAKTLARLTDPDTELGALEAYGLAMEMLDNVVEESPRPCQPKVSNLQQYYVDESIRYIKTKYPQDISVEDVAQYCGLNRSYLGKLFRDATGMTTQEYLIRQRMSVACHYLQIGAAPIATIARSVGYPNQLHFSRAFHKVFGIPPREWQKRNRKNGK
jgi:AraC-like DNA-binding protein